MKADQDGVTAQLDKVLSMDGDVDVSQRKGKVITIFDVKVVIEYSGKLISDQTLSKCSPNADQEGKTKEDEDVSGTITVPEIAHDTEENEYVVRLFVPMGACARPN